MSASAAASVSKKRTVDDVDQTSAVNSSKKIKIPHRKLKHALGRRPNEPLWRMDWPEKEGPIDLAVQDLPHDSSNTEWWYLNSHLKTADGRELSIFVAFFRIIRSYDAVTEEGEFAHTLLFAVSDPANDRYLPTGYVDPDCCALLLERLKDHEATDKRLNVAMREMLERGSMPGPDVPLDADTLKISFDNLMLDYSGNTLVKDADGNYLLHCHSPDSQTAFTLKFEPKKTAVRQGHQGLTHVGREGEEMFYYFISRHAVTGSITLDGQTQAVTGQGWYDHEFGGTIKPGNAAQNERAEKQQQKQEQADQKSDDVQSSSSSSSMETDAAKEDKSGKNISSSFGWHWSSIQLDNGVDLSSTYLWKVQTNETSDQYTVVIGPNSERTVFSEMSFKSTNYFTSVRTYQSFPCAFSLVVPDAGIDLVLEADVPDSEFITAISEPSFYEVRVLVKGTYGGQSVSGRGFVEVHGYNNLKKLDTFLKAVSKQVSKYVDKIIPHNASYQHMVNLMGGDEFQHYGDGLSVENFNKTVVEPLRIIIDRGGKSWRSYSCLLCIDVVGGNSRDFPEMLAMPELMHVGSLIVDDIQDKSETRRGGPSCHKMFGDAIAINAGNAAYFLSEYGFATNKKIDAERKVRLYEIYFEALRAGHIGQAADIFGLDYQMEHVVAQGGGPALLRSVCGTHRLKSAAPAGALARMGAILGRGTKEQVDKLGRFFEALGVAFQIMDDVLNLRGMRSGKQTLKILGEDLMEGKITYPVARGMCLWDLPQRQRMWGIISSKPQDQAVVGEVIAELEKCGALQASVDDATSMVDDAWEEVSKCLKDSFYKAMLRAFSFFVLDRHY